MKNKLAPKNTTIKKILFNFFFNFPARTKWIFLRNHGIFILKTLGALISSLCFNNFVFALENNLTLLPFPEVSILTSQSMAQMDADAVNHEAKNAFLWLYANLNAPAINPGIVIASPSRFEPDYFRHWIRDSGLTMLEIAKNFKSASNTDLKQNSLNTLLKWVDREKNLQNKASLSTYDMGEPLFTVDGEVYLDWGRPQNDGPAIRALAMMEFVQGLQMDTTQDNTDYINSLYKAELPAYTPIKRDLEFVAQHWMDASIDLWEEVRGTHFFTRMAQRAALYRGAQLATYMNDPFAAKNYRKQADAITKQLYQHIDKNQKLIMESINQTGGWTHKKSNLDVSIILASLYFSLEDGVFGPNDPYILNTADRLESIFKTLYPINQGTAEDDLGVAIGRYPEDVYNGAGFSQANPWFIATNAYAELNCLRALNAPNLNDARDFLHRGYQFMKRTIHHIDGQGHMSEQFDRNNGFLHGASDLTWSYVSYLRAHRVCTQANVLPL